VQTKGKKDKSQRHVSCSGSTSNRVVIVNPHMLIAAEDMGLPPSRQLFADCILRY
jgi:hypothetical protein